MFYHNWWHRMPLSTPLSGCDIISGGARLFINLSILNDSRGSFSFLLSHAHRCFRQHWLSNCLYDTPVGALRCKCRNAAGARERVTIAGSILSKVKRYMMVHPFPLICGASEVERSLCIWILINRLFLSHPFRGPPNCKCIPLKLVKHAP